MVVCETEMIMSEQKHYRTCHLCEAMCGIEIRHENGNILSIRGDKEDTFSRGHVCPKAVALQDLQDDPNRLRNPVKKTADGWEEISWEEALSTTASRLNAIRKKHGNDSVGLYIGNPTAHNHGALLMLPMLLGALRTKNRYSATSVDQLPHMLAAHQMFGNMGLLAIPDIDRTDYWMVLGGNPMASNGSIMTAPDIKARIKAIKERGGKVVVIDPRRSETAEVASEHIAIRPGGDSYLLLGMLHVLYNNNMAEPGHVASFTNGLRKLGELVQAWTPERASQHCGIPAETIIRLANEVGAANSAAVYGRVGLTTSPNSTVAGWLLYAINVVSGNLDQPGGMMFTQPAFDLVGIASLFGVKGSFDKYRSRVRNLPEFGDEFPVVTLADEILEPGKGQIRAMVTHAGNPVLSTPDGQRLDEALEKVDFMVSIDIYINETTRHADIILPPVGPLERAQFDPAFHFVSIRNTIKFSPAMIEPQPGALRDWEIMIELSTRLMDRGRLSRPFARALKRVMMRLGDEGMIDLAIRLGPYGDRGSAIRMLDQLAGELPGSKLFWPPIRKRILKYAGRLSAVMQPYLDGFDEYPNLNLDKIKAEPHGIDLGPLRPVFPERLGFRNKRINLTPDIFVEALEEMSQAPAPQSDGFIMIGRRHLRSNNSWMHNSHRLVKGKDRCTAMVNPEDAARLGIKEGDQMDISSASGSIRLAAEITDQMMPGVVSVPHGWGHHREGVELDVATEHAGVSINDVIGTQVHDPVTGMAILNGVEVQVKAVARASQPEAA